jgi:lysozyme
MFGSPCFKAVMGFVVCAAMVAIAQPAKALVYGLDLYAGNGTMNWPLIAGAGRQFTWVKATEGVGYEDGQLQNNENNGTNNGVLVGAYDFCHPEDNTPLAEAQYFHNFADGSLSGNAFNAFASGKLVPALDLEDGAGDTIVGAANLATWAVDWCQDVKSLTGVNPVIYCNQNYANNYLGGDSAIKNYALWIAAYNVTPAISSSPWGAGGYTFQQYSSNTVIQGDPAAFADADEYFNSLASLVSTYAIGGVAPAGMIVPEPSCIALLLGIGTLGLSRRRRTT